MSSLGSIILAALFYWTVIDANFVVAVKLANKTHESLLTLSGW